MAFKKTVPPPQVPATPDELLRLLSRRRIPDVLPHQRAIMRAYANTAATEPDVALQLPTGSGKTLVGLLIAEWKRRSKKEKVLYLCPTRQLVNQVVEEANLKYGLSVLGFTGSAKSYEPAAATAYKLGDHVAVTTYSSLFNSNPYFSDPDTVIIDDAHTAEAYVSSTWSLQISRRAPDTAVLFGLLVELLGRFLSVDVKRRMTDVPEDDDYVWVDKISTPDLLAISDELIEVLDINTQGIDLRYQWKLIRNHILSCHIYVGIDAILIRPISPPTWSLTPFQNASQRIYMSATLGAGGDLERLLGRRSITRLPTAAGWDRQGVGRRFFIFPNLSLTPTQIVDLRGRLMKAAGRSLVLVKSDTAAKEVIAEVTQSLGFPTLTAPDIEVSKSAFTSRSQAVAVIANRYDGIDFPGDDCRLLIIDGLPKSMNLQERFMMSRMGANILFNERIQTRVLQAIGRCTRSLEDYSTVLIGGEHLSDYLIDPKRRKFLHPELQAELQFGIEQSTKVDIPDLAENFNIFLNDRQRWEDAEQEIVSARQTAVQESFPSIDELEAAVSDEVRYQEEMWKGDYETAMGFAQSVLGKLSGEKLKGYRAMWHYLAGSAAWLAAHTSGAVKEAQARAHYMEAKKAASALPWLARLTVPLENVAQEVTPDPLTMIQIENLESKLEKLGVLHDAAFTKLERSILDGINGRESNAFEEAHRKLGDLLGFISDNSNGSAAPDPWWYVENLGIVFEDHSDGEATSALGAVKARQVQSHPLWLKDNDVQSRNVNFQPILVTPVTRVEKNAAAFLENVYLWNLEDFRAWTRASLGHIRTLRTTFHEAGDLVWRGRAFDIFVLEKMGIESLLRHLSNSPAKFILTED